MPTMIDTPGVYSNATHKIDMAQSELEDIFVNHENAANAILNLAGQVASYVPQLQAALNQAATPFAYVQGGRHGVNDLAGVNLTERYRNNWGGAHAIKEAVATLQSLCATMIAMVPHPETGAEGAAEYAAMGWVNP